MASTLNVTTALVNDHYLITASLADGGTLPKEIFIYTNPGDGTLGEFFGTCNIQELGRLTIATPGTAQPTYGNKYLRYGQAKIIVPLGNDPTAVASALVKNVTTLSLAYAAQTSSTASYSIP